MNDLHDNLYKSFFFLLLLGAALCILSSLPALHSLVPSVGKYFMVITGQGITAFSALIVINLVNKVSQNWFSPKERTLATTILSLNPTAAMMISVFVTPLFVTSSEFIPYMNIIWGTPSIIGIIIALFKVIIRDGQTLFHFSIK